MTEDRSVNSVAVIGFGYWGKNLVRNYHQLGALKLVCDKYETGLRLLQEQYPDVESTLTFHDVLTREDIYGVVISTPAETHFTLAREALLSGKHVYVEKPLVLFEEQGRELIALAEQKGLILMVGHLLQYHPVFVHLRKLASEGELGRINYIYSHRLNLGKIRREENIFWSFAPHDISMILSLTGEEPERTDAVGGYFLHKKIADVTTTHLEFPSGIQAHIFVSWLHPFKEQKLVVVGDRKMAVFDDTRPWEDKLLLYPHRIDWANNMPIPAKADAERVDIPEAEPLRVECQHFLHCIQTGRRPRTDGEEGLRVLRVLNAGQRSLDRAGLDDSQFQATPMQFPADPSSSPQAAVHSPPHAFPHIRQRPADQEEPLDYFVHPTAIVEKDVSIGKETKIWHFSHILPGSRIGERCNLGQNVVVGPDVAIADGCKIQNNVSVYKGVTLEEDVFCGPSMVFTNVFNPRANIRRMDELRRTAVRRGATLGANCTIVCGVAIGRYALVGAGAVVTQDVPDYALVVGNPAKRIGWICACGVTLGDDLECRACGMRYTETAPGVLEERKTDS